MAADMPNANRLTVGIMAMVAEEERRMISARTKAALQAAKARGTKLGGYRGHKPTEEMREAAAEALRQRTTGRVDSLAPIIAELQAAGITSATGLAKALTERGVPTRPRRLVVVDGTGAAGAGAAAFLRAIFFQALVRALR